MLLKKSLSLSETETEELGKGRSGSAGWRQSGIHQGGESKEDQETQTSSFSSTVICMVLYSY